MHTEVCGGYELDMYICVYVMSNKSCCVVSAYVAFTFRVLQKQHPFCLQKQGMVKRYCSVLLLLQSLPSALAL